MRTSRPVFVTDCEGPVSKNDNAFELTSRVIPGGEQLFTQLSGYDDVLADVVKRKDYKAGNTLKLILPFLKAYGVTDKQIADFSAGNLLLMPGAKDMLQLVRRSMPAFIVSTSYEHYLEALCHVLDFPFEDTYCTRLNLDTYRLRDPEIHQLKQLRKMICEMPPLLIHRGATSLQMLPEESQQAVRRLDRIFWEEIMSMGSGAILREVNPVGGAEKARAVQKIVNRTGSHLGHLMYVGDSITDVECLRLVRANGGLTVSFNGNSYAVREAGIAILSTNAIVIAALADVFSKLGPESAYELADDWSGTSLKKRGVAPALRERLRSTFRNKPKIHRVTADNVDKIEIESSAFRRFVRGEKVGRLG